MSCAPLSTRFSGTRACCAPTRSPPEKRQRAIEIIERNARAQNQLVEDLLDISRITTGTVRLDVQPIPVMSPLQEALESVKLPAEAKRIEIEVHADPFAGTVNADAARLQQVFWNLLSNAVKFTAEGGRIVVALESENGSVRVTAKDSGIGISPEFLRHVFEPFRQADGRFSREYGGLGLGLAICKQIVELHGGTIAAESDAAGGGSTFTMRLPRFIAAATDFGAGASEMPDDAIATRHGPAISHPNRSDSRQLTGVDVLVVDDEDDSLELLCEVLESAGAAVRVATNGDQALREFDKQAPDLLVADLGLPVMDGYELLRRVRSRSPKWVPAIAVTAYARLDDRTETLAAGFEDHVAKPIDPEGFVKIVGGLVQRV